MAFVMRIPEFQVMGPGKFKDRHGRTDAVTFVQQVAGAPHAGVWRPGKWIKEAQPGAIPPGVAIATFNSEGRFINDKLGCHAAIYLTHDNHRILVLDQWPLQGEVRRRSILFDVKPDTERGADGKTFYVIE